MTEYRFDAAEVACIKRLAELFEKGTHTVSGMTESEPETALGLPDERRESLLARMEHIGVIADVRHGDAFRFFSFQISPRVVELARAIREEEGKPKQPRDIVEDIKESARRNPIIAWLIIASLVLVPIAAILTIVEKIIGFFK